MGRTLRAFLSLSWFALHPTSYDAKSLKTDEQDAGDYGLTQKKSVVQFVQEWHNLAEDIFNEDEQVQVFLQVSVRWKNYSRKLGFYSTRSRL